MRPDAALFLCLLAASPALQPPRPLRVVTAEATREVEVRSVGGAEMLVLADLAAALGGSFRDAGADGPGLLQVGDRIARFDRDRSFVTVEGRMRVLREPSRVVGGDWMVPFDFVARVLPDVLPGDSDFDPRERILFRGASTRLMVDVSRTPGATRVTVRTDPAVPLGAQEVEGFVLVPIPVPFLETQFAGESPRDGVVEEVRLRRRGRDYAIEVETGPNYGRTVRRNVPGGIQFDLLRAAVSAGDRLTNEAPEAPRQRSAPLPRGIRTVVIDPGHGGPDSGVVGAGGLAEKDLALLVARELQDVLQSEYGLRAILTRDQDRAVQADDRAAFANAARADVMVSLHANASMAGGASGSYVYFYAPSRSGRAATPDPASFVRWEDSQLPWAPESRRLAEALLAELGALDVPARDVAGAPVLVLGRAAMPAVQVELGFLTSSADRARLARPNFARRAATALAEGLLRYRSLIAGPRGTGGSE